MVALYFAELTTSFMAEAIFVLVAFYGVIIFTRGARAAINKIDDVFFK